MAAKENCKECITNWRTLPARAIWAVISQVVIFGLFLAGFCSDHWLESFVEVSGYEYRSQGLWRFCYESLGITCCGYINDVMYVETFLDATRSFLVMSLLSQIIGIFGIFWGITTGYETVVYNQGGTAAALSAFLIILAIIIYGGASQDEDSTSQYSLSWSYALCTASGLLYIPFTCLICLIY